MSIMYLLSLSTDSPPVLKNDSSSICIVGTKLLFDVSPFNNYTIARYFRSVKDKEGRLLSAM